MHISTREHTDAHGHSCTNTQAHTCTSHTHVRIHTHAQACAHTLAPCQGGKGSVYSGGQSGGRWQALAWAWLRFAAWDALQRARKELTLEKQVLAGLAARASVRSLCWAETPARVPGAGSRCPPRPPGLTLRTADKNVQPPGATLASGRAGLGSVFTSFFSPVERGLSPWLLPSGSVRGAGGSSVPVPATPAANSPPPTPAPGAGYGSGSVQAAAPPQASRVAHGTEASAWVSRTTGPICGCSQSPVPRGRRRVQFRSRARADCQGVADAGTWATCPRGGPEAGGGW